MVSIIIYSILGFILLWHLVSILYGYFILHVWILDIKSSDFSKATDCGMSAFFYVYYSRIFQKQIECHKNGILPKEKITWPNHWLKYCKYQDELSRTKNY